MRVPRIQEKKPSSWKYVLEFLMLLPFFLLFFSVFESTFSTINIIFPSWAFLVALLVSFLSYSSSRLSRNRLFLAGEIPADTSMFVADLLLFPFILSFPPNAVGAANYFASLDIGIVVFLGVLVLVISRMDKKLFPKRDNLTVFATAAFGDVILSAFSVMLFAFNAYATLAFILSYFTVLFLIMLAIYTLQIFAYLDRFDFLKGF